MQKVLGVDPGQSEKKPADKMINDQSMQHGFDWTGTDPAGWLVSEKMDGCRAYWDGSQFWTRSGRKIAVPDSIRRAMPRCHLDGEFWAGRGRFTEARLAVNHGKWTARVRFVVFDSPKATGDWTQRIESARAMGVECVRWWACDSGEELLRDLDRIVSAGGEGVIIRKPNGAYTFGRCWGVQKVKPHKVKMEMNNEAQ
jgi:DNA ligase-1